jgi:hypothetical protein
MLKTKIKLVYLKFDNAKFNKTLIENLETLSRQAARAWLRAVLLHVPTYTGEARGSLRPLGAFLRVAIPISPSSSRQAQYAMSHGHTADAGEGQGKFEFTIVGAKVSFSFSSDVMHYLINEFYDVSDQIHLKEQVPWHSFAAGKLAYKNYINENVKTKIPKLKSFVLREVQSISIP